jgi:hypothetical protein
MWKKANAIENNFTDKIVNYFTGKSVYLFTEIILAWRSSLSPSPGPPTSHPVADNFRSISVVSCLILFVKLARIWAKSWKIDLNTGYVFSIRGTFLSYPLTIFHGSSPIQKLFW